MPDENIMYWREKSIFCIFFGALFFSLSMFTHKAKSLYVHTYTFIYIHNILTHTCTRNDKRQHLYTHLFFFLSSILSFLGNPQHEKYVSLLLLLPMLLLLLLLLYTYTFSYPLTLSLALLLCFHILFLSIDTTVAWCCLLPTA